MWSSKSGRMQSLQTSVNPSLASLRLPLSTLMQPTCKPWSTGKRWSSWSSCWPPPWLSRTRWYWFPPEGIHHQAVPAPCSATWVSHHWMPHYSERNGSGIFLPKSLAPFPSLKMTTTKFRGKWISSFRLLSILQCLPPSWHTIKPVAMWYWCSRYCVLYK